MKEMTNSDESVCIQRPHVCFDARVPIAPPVVQQQIGILDELTATVRRRQAKVEHLYVLTTGMRAKNVSATMRNAH